MTKTNQVDVRENNKQDASIPGFCHIPKQHQLGQNNDTTKELLIVALDKEWWKKSTFRGSKERNG